MSAAPTDRSQQIDELRFENIVVETAVFFDNNFRFAKTGAAEITIYYSGGVGILVFDEVQP